MSEKIKIRCADCLQGPTPPIEPFDQEFSLLTIIEPNRDYNLIDLIKSTSLIMNHHFTARGPYGGHAHFRLYDQDNQLIGYLKVSAAAQKISTRLKKDNPS